MHAVHDTIAGIASAPGGALRGIVRLSGPQVVACLNRCFRSDDRRSLSQLSSATAVGGTMQLEDRIGDLPGRLYLWPTTRSYTRQTAAEFHTLGSPPLLDALLRTVCRCGARLAQPGEFTMRAFLAGRLDLTQAEAVLGVIDARDRDQLQVALQQLAGGLASPLEQLRSELLDLLAQLEAGLDFVEEDIEFITAGELLARLEAASHRVAQLADQLAVRGQHGDLVRVVLVGLTNVGKSSLFNALLEQSAALVSEAAGTTRDYLTAVVALAQVEAELVDTAGVDSQAVAESVDGAAQQIAAAQRRQADLQILCLDATRPLKEWERAALQARDESRIVVFTKADLARPSALRPGAVVTSSRSGEGLGELRVRIRDWIEASAAAWGGAVPSTAARCRESLRLAAAALRRAVGVVRRQGGEELVAHEVRGALDELGQVVGAVYTDDLLERIFSRFCIGK